MLTSHSIRQLHSLCSSLVLFSAVVLDRTSESPVLSTTLGVNEAGNSESDGGGKKEEEGKKEKKKGNHNSSTLTEFTLQLRLWTLPSTHLQQDCGSMI